MVGGETVESRSHLGQSFHDSKVEEALNRSYHAKTFNLIESLEGVYFGAYGADAHIKGSISRRSGLRLSKERPWPPIP